jgi:tetratricopeptide (TPR) repeat protein
MLTHMLSHMGVELGEPLQPPSFDNPRGFWENRFFQAINIDLLERAHCDPNGFASGQVLANVSASFVSQPCSYKELERIRVYIERIFQNTHWGWKDPRTVITFPYWISCIEKLGLNDIRPVIILRHPDECIQSLTRRGDFDNYQIPERLSVEEYISSIWTAYYHLIDVYAPPDSIVVLHEDILDPRLAESELVRCAEYLGLGQAGIGPALATVDLNLVAHGKRKEIEFRSDREREVYGLFFERARRQKERFANKLRIANSALEPSQKQISGRYCIYIVSPEGYPHSRAFDEHALCLHYAFRRLGYVVPIVRNRWEISGTPIVFGANLLTGADRESIPPDSILYNLEQIHLGSPWLKQEYLDLLRSYRIWDYSRTNIREFSKLDIESVGLCEVGYVPESTCIESASASKKDIDVLFYGSLNPRRQVILDQLEKRGINVVSVFGAYGLRRDKLIAKSKIILNVHFYESKILEVVRISHLLANGCFVVSEKGGDPDTNREFEGAVVLEDYDAIVDSCVRYLVDAEQRLRIARKGHELMASRRQEEYLAQALASLSNEPPLLALVLIARDEQNSIERCLESVKPYVDEMIVLDTGSSDSTKEIARRCGAKVFDFEWCDDFSAARNAALLHSSARWNLILDADEWIESKGAELLKAIRNRDPYVGLIPVASGYDLNGNVEVVTSWMPRVLPRGVKYDGMVHEQPVSNLPRKKINTKIGHCGYRQERLELKKGRNRALLSKMLQARPSDPYLLYQLGRDHEVYEDFSEAVDLFVKALEVTPESVQFRHDLIVRLLYCLKKTGAHEPAVEFAEAEMPKWQDSPDFFFVLGDLALDWANACPEKSKELLPMIEACWLRCLEIGDRPDLEGSVQGRGSYLAAHNLAVFYSGIGDEGKAKRYVDLARRESSI